MRRIMVIGAPGSGKSTLALRLGEITGLPVHHMDRIHYRPGWVSRTRAEKIALANEVEAREAWIFEGGMSSTYTNRAARADLVVLLDLPLMLRLWRVLRRWWRFRGRTRPDLAPDCPDRLDPEFIWWIISTARKNARRDRALVAALPPGKGVHLRSQAQMDRWLSGAAMDLIPA